MSVWIQHFLQEVVKDPALRRNSKATNSVMMKTTTADVAGTVATVVPSLANRSFSIAFALNLTNYFLFQKQFQYCEDCECLDPDYDYEDESGSCKKTCAKEAFQGDNFCDDGNNPGLISCLAFVRFNFTIPTKDPRASLITARCFVEVRYAIDRCARKAQVCRCGLKQIISENWGT